MHEEGRADLVFLCYDGLSFPVFPGCWIKFGSGYYVVCISSVSFSVFPLPYRENEKFANAIQAGELNRSLSNYRLHLHVSHLHLLPPSPQSPRLRPQRSSLCRMGTTLLRLGRSRNHDLHRLRLRLRDIPPRIVGRRNVLLVLHDGFRMPGIVRGLESGQEDEGGEARGGGFGVGETGD